MYASPFDLDFDFYPVKTDVKHIHDCHDVFDPVCHLFNNNQSFSRFANVAFCSLGVCLNSMAYHCPSEDFLKLGT